MNCHCPCAQALNCICVCGIYKKESFIFANQKNNLFKPLSSTCWCFIIIIIIFFKENGHIYTRAVGMILTYAVGSFLIKNTNKNL